MVGRRNILTGELLEGMQRSCTADEIKEKVQEAMKKTNEGAYNNVTFKNAIEDAAKEGKGTYSRLPKGSIESNPNGTNNFRSKVGVKSGKDSVYDTITADNASNANTSQYDNVKNASRAQQQERDPSLRDQKHSELPIQTTTDSLSTGEQALTFEGRRTAISAVYESGAGTHNVQNGIKSLTNPLKIHHSTGLGFGGLSSTMNREQSTIRQTVYVATKFVRDPLNHIKNMKSERKAYINELNDIKTINPTQRTQEQNNRLQELHQKIKEVTDSINDLNATIKEAGNFPERDLATNNEIGEVSVGSDFLNAVEAVEQGRERSWNEFFKQQGELTQNEIADLNGGIESAIYAEIVTQGSSSSPYEDADNLFKPDGGLNTVKNESLDTMLEQSIELTKPMASDGLVRGWMA